MARTREFDEDQVVAAVLDTFQDTGYAATSLDDIMRTSGLGKGSLYGAFGNKRSLFLRAFDAYCANVTDALGAALRGPDESAHQRLIAVLRSSTTGSEAATVRACFLARTTAELAAQDDDVASRARATFETLAESLITCVEQAQAAGYLGHDKNPTALGHFLLSILRGNEALAEARIDPAVLSDVVDVAVHTLEFRDPQ